MVAYNFQKRFVPHIVSGLKHHTIRPEREGRSRHARVGEMAQLYTGLRTKHARKIMADRPVTAVRAIHISVTDVTLRIFLADQKGANRRELSQPEVALFAAKDGFGLPAREAYRAMLDFWTDTYGTGLFKGVLIEWQPPEPGI